MIYRAARWRQKPGGVDGTAALAMINHAANKGDGISPDVDGDSDLVRDFHMSTPLGVCCRNSVIYFE